MKVKSLSCVRLLATPWTAAYQAPPSMGFSRQEYWSGVPLPSPCFAGDGKVSVWSVFFTGAGQGKKNEVNGIVCLISCKNQENLSVEKVILKQEICKIKKKKLYSL